MDKYEQATKEVALFNATFPVGSDVIRYKLIRPLRHGYPTKTRSAAFLLGGDTACVMVEGVSGCVICESITPVA